MRPQLINYHKDIIMKKILLLIGLLTISKTYVLAQDIPITKLAKHISDKMSDSLGLTIQQRAKIFLINEDLAKQKEKARKKNVDRERIRKEMQLIEEFRDGLYKKILTKQQFTLYKQKKVRLVSAN